MRASCAWRRGWLRRTVAFGHSDRAQTDRAQTERAQTDRAQTDRGRCDHVLAAPSPWPSVRRSSAAAADKASICVCLSRLCQDSRTVFPCWRSSRWGVCVMPPACACMVQCISTLNAHHGLHLRFQGRRVLGGCQGHPPASPGAPGPMARRRNGRIPKSPRRVSPRARKK